MIVTALVLFSSLAVVRVEVTSIGFKVSSSADATLMKEKLIERRPLSMKIDGKIVFGIPSKYMDPLYSKKLLGKKVKRDIPKDTMLVWDDLE